MVSLREIDLYIGKTLDREIARLNSRRIVDPYKMSPQMSELGAADGEFFFISRVHKGRISGMRSDYDLVYGIPEAKGGAAALPSACNADLDRAIWDAIRNETHPDFFEAYLKRVESGELCGLFADIARLKVRPSVSPAPVEPAAGTDTALATLDAPGAEAALNLRPEDRRVIQEALTALDFDTRGLDGVFGANTRRAIIGWQGVTGEEPTGYLTASQYGRLLAEAEPKLAALESARRQPEQASPVQPAVGVHPPPPGDEFRDCEGCPLMVVVPAGSFLMGAPTSEEGRTDDEGPQHTVTIDEPFAVGKYEVTFDEWDACVADGGCSEKPHDQGWGRGDRPVINVSSNNAKEYVDWLKKKTGKLYHLPSEAQWEYAARAGTSTPFWTGPTISTDQANYDGSYTYGPGQKGEYRKRTTPVDTFAANPWGLHDMHGNVWEWVEDCWNESYSGAPKDGSPLGCSGDCGAGCCAGAPGSTSSVPALRQPRQERHRQPERRSGLPGCQDASYPLILDLFTPWGLGRSPSRVFLAFLGVAGGAFRGGRTWLSRSHRRTQAPRGTPCPARTTSARPSSSSSRDTTTRSWRRARWCRTTTRRCCSPTPAWCSSRTSSPASSGGPTSAPRPRRNACAPAASTTTSTTSATPRATTPSSRCSATSRSATTSRSARSSWPGSS